MYNTFWWYNGRVKHGKYCTYKNLKCRCDPCTAAHSEYKKKQREKYASSKPVKEHGTYSSYINYNCRCGPCKLANIEKNQTKAEERQILINSIKTKSGCVDCGYNEHPIALDFDHIQGIKVKAVSTMIRYPLEKVFAEIDKCEVVCSNCHRIRTLQRRQIIEDEV